MSFYRQNDFSIHNPFCGIPIIENMYMCEAEEIQYRFPRSKKARIRKKWARRPQNWKSIARDQVFMVGNKLVCSPSIHAKLKAEAIRLIENGVVQFNRHSPEGLRTRHFVEGTQHPLVVAPNLPEK